ncbi:MAG: nucleotidyltransferase family protein [Chloroflexi bacterium]|nr:nucleotidyltransferase family protein [Chloroflexota bacterium]
MDQRTAGELLLYCLGMGTDETRAARLEQLSTSDWDDLIQQSARHGATPLLYRRFTTNSTNTHIPTTVMQRLREIYLYSAKENIRLYHELAKVLKTLQNDGIPVIALKGACLAEVVYGNIALRPMGDVDLLVRRTDLSRVEEKLLEMGYGSPEHPSIEEQCEKAQHLVGFTKPEAILIEIHWTIETPTSPFKVDVDGLWKRARPATIAGVKVLVLSPEDLILHLCLHGSLHHKFRFGLKPFCDIAETIRHYWDEMDWEQVQLRAHQWGVSKCVYLTLYLARELLKAAVPDEVLEALKPDGFNLQVAAWAREQIFADESDSPSLSPNLAQFWGPRRLQDKAILLLKSVFPSPEVMAKMYPAPPDSPRIYLYYPVRLKDLLLRHGRATWQMLRRDEEMMALVERENRKTALSDWLASA